MPTLLLRLVAEIRKNIANFNLRKMSALTAVIGYCPIEHGHCVLSWNVGGKDKDNSTKCFAGLSLPPCHSSLEEINQVIRLSRKST